MSGVFEVPQLNEVREAIASGDFSMSALATEAGMSHRTVGHLMEPDWDPRLSTIRRLHGALIRLREQRSGEDNEPTQTRTPGGGHDAEGNRPSILRDGAPGVLACVGCEPGAGSDSSATADGGAPDRRRRRGRGEA